MVDFNQAYYEVLVGNVGRVMATNDRAEANKTFDAYVAKSRSNIGRAAGESVTLFADNEIRSEYLGELIMYYFVDDNHALIQTSHGYDSDDGSAYCLVEYFPPYASDGAVQHASQSTLMIFTNVGD